jgi:AcrR family transcriptional regulator
MPTQQQRSDATREALVAACRRLLLEEGAEAATMAAVLARTGLSKGAAYHHFASKTDLIAAIYRAESQGAIARAAARAASGAATPLARLAATCAAWLAEVRDPDVAAILLRIGPAMLGIEEAQRIENAHSLALFEDMLARAAAEGEIAATLDRVLAARILNAVMAELALATLRRSGQPLPDVGALVIGVLRGMEGAG